MNQNLLVLLETARLQAKGMKISLDQLRGSKLDGKVMAELSLLVRENNDGIAEIQKRQAELLDQLLALGFGLQDKVYAMPSGLSQHGPSHQDLQYEIVDAKSVRVSLIGGGLPKVQVKPLLGLYRSNEFVLKSWSVPLLWRTFCEDILARASTTLSDGASKSAKALIDVNEIAAKIKELRRAA